VSVAEASDANKTVALNEDGGRLYVTVYNLVRVQKNEGPHQLPGDACDDSLGQR
jgi:hypothetical protein